VSDVGRSLEEERLPRRVRARKKEGPRVPGVMDELVYVYIDF
jgi:hypothetical protein